MFADLASKETTEDIREKMMFIGDKHPMATKCSSYFFNLDTVIQAIIQDTLRHVHRHSDGRKRKSHLSI